MISQPQVFRAHSPTKYFALEVATKIRYEYVSGDIVPITDGLSNHNRIIHNLCPALAIVLQSQDFEVLPPIRTRGSG